MLEQRFQRHRPVEQEALHAGIAVAREIPGLGLGLDAFGDHRHAQSMRQAGDRAHPARPREALDAFVSRRFGRAATLAVISGGIPVSGGLKRMSTHGFMAVGDAAHHAEPLTGGGINTAMMGADLAARTAVANILLNMDEAISKN